MNTDYDKMWHALETAFAYYDHLIEQGKSHSEAIDHTCQRFGIIRAQFVELVEARKDFSC